MDSIIDVKKYLIESGLIDRNDEPIIENLPGGVSSNVWKIVLNNKRWVMKQALRKLKVEAEWFSDVERIHREHEVMVALNDLIPKGIIPKVVHVDYTKHIYIMESAEEGAQTWKEILMHGNLSITIAENAGYLLSEIHLRSNDMDAGNKIKFQDQTYFVQLRIEPFHRCLMQRYPDLASEIQELIDELTLQKICLVHGDFSPKNMLLEKENNILLIDFEVAHWGNPVFDIAYCVGHLMLKGWFLKKQQEFLELIEAFLRAYGSKINNLMPHLGLMLLARMDGKSPINYINDQKMKESIRKVAINWIQNKTQGNDVSLNIRNAFELS